MKPAEAAKNLDEWYPDCSLALHPKFPEAVKLGKFALERILKMRSFNIGMAIMPLPGENPIPDLSPSAARKQTLRESPPGKEPRS